MKPLMIALALSASLAAAPAMAFSLNTGNLTRDLSFPEPAPETVTKDKAQTRD
ncbi:hypothetical protein [Ruegeria sp.]|uniref:hypothetical protein n=1 Tax=Ruegeria sp. TaxID=1879320 RepID=UPI002316F418|nr:hypothetical protein [Ruegeria sp.]MDA7964713.1 hypothetical protein [Ruegeria sp.]